ncbi:hypothetical protein PR048_003871 [Dryococelus australis]|uniref:PiggyBac transposable element-derived protein domain-containing protein n=1 Tax=Dryococelus australis TaxID=614101 RepID=A0ABQ9IPE0_9NEOP|nr:hypothetical protein PR048_003871 [Dryococelus australis]
MIQLVSFRGHSSLVQYIPSKLGKYEIKFFWMCECDTGYAIDGCICAGKFQGEKPTQNLAFNVVKLLVVNITTDNSFASVLLTEYLLEKNLTMVGSLRRNKRDVPIELKDCKNQHLYTSRFAFNNYLTIIIYTPKKNKRVLLLSTMQYESSNDEEHSKKKPEIIKYYNSTKGGVDMMDQKIWLCTCKHKTKRRPVVIWSNIMEVAEYNAYMLFQM